MNSFICFYHQKVISEKHPAQILIHIQSHYHFSILTWRFLFNKTISIQSFIISIIIRSIIPIGNIIVFPILIHYNFYKDLFNRGKVKLKKIKALHYIVLDYGGNSAWHYLCAIIAQYLGDFMLRGHTQNLLLLLAPQLNIFFDLFVSGSQFHF